MRLNLRSLLLMLVPGIGLGAQQTVSSTLRTELISKAGAYPFNGAEFFGKDSVRLVFADSSLTGKGISGDTWMFGPPATKAESENCPPAKVLGRKIARVYWRGAGKPAALQEVIVRVQGTTGLDRFSYVDLHYSRSDLERPWAGDPDGK